MFWLIIAGLAFIMMTVIYFVGKGQQDFYLEREETSKTNDSLRCFVRYGTIVLRAKGD